MNRDILELYNHLSKLQHELKKAEFGKVKHKVYGFQTEKSTLSSWCQSQEKTNPEKILKLLEVLTNQEKRIGLPEEDLDVTFLENQAYTDKLDEHRALIASIQDQLDRGDWTSIPGQLLELIWARRISQPGQQQRDQPEAPLFYSSARGGNRECGPATVTIEDTVQDLEVQKEEAHKAAFKACFAASKAKHNRPASPIWQALTATTVTHNTLLFFKTANLPRVDRKSNVAMFLWLYQNSVYGA
ncbi:hypothetical protein DSO57_1005196 [Entomophthora muscae]|uniref:Uncharacterized protein n=1 Tax=Entomophthora muscae TaxID=34485 RepID=A0ACC2T8Q7_9FUNG|nr:hypothetical protein DSO57_1005196 [Entomophthora muscae]